MVAPAEAFPGRKGEEDKPRRLSVQEKVIGILDKMGIDTDPEPHIEEFTRKYMAGTPPREEIAYDGYGEPVRVTIPGLAPMEEEEARELAELTAWRGVRASVEKQLEEIGVGERMADIIASTAAGRGVRSTSGYYGISTKRVYQLIDKFCSQYSL